jgi:hypothetical protein
MAELQKFTVHIEKVFYIQAETEIPANDEQDARNQVELANTNQELDKLGFVFGEIEPIEMDDDEIPEGWGEVNLNIISVKLAAAVEVGKE